jgi:glycine betaine catabolism A
MFNQSVAAPLDPVDLKPCLLPFGTSRMLPKAAYLDDSVLAWERAHIFGDWLCLGRSSSLPSAASQRAVSVGESSVLLVRDLDGVLRAFENTCRHRGHELLPCGGESAKRTLVCPYHAWTYDLDGSLRVARGFRDVDGFDRSEFGLAELDVREWHGWVFVDPSGQAGDFAEHIGELESIIGHYDAERLVTAVTHEYDVQANWKVIIENYQECFHCAMIHPELCRVSPPESGENIERVSDWVGGWMDLRGDAATMSLDGHSDGKVIARLDEVEQRTVMYVAVLPNLLISLHPDYIMTHLLTAISPGVTRISCSWAFPPEAVEGPGFDPSYAVDFWDLTNRQDWAACESVQRGMHSPHYAPGPLAPDEDGVYHFVTLMARKYLGLEPVRSHARVKQVSDGVK